MKNVIMCWSAKAIFVLSVAWCLLFSGDAKGGDDVVDIRQDEILGPAFVVKATVQEVGMSNRQEVVTLHIDEVLHGPKALATNSVVMPVFKKGGHGVLILDPPLQEGEEGIWLVKMKQERVVIDVFGIQKWQFLKMPARKVISKNDFDSAEQWGRHVGAANKLGRVPKKELLRQYSTNENTRTATWAGLSLERIEKKEQKATDKKSR